MTSTGTLRESRRRGALLLAALAVLAATATLIADGPANAAASDYSLDFTAAAPTTYDHSTGGGAFNDGGTASTKESLEQGDFVCGEIVTYLLQIVVDAGADAGDHQISIDFSFAVEGTNGNRAGHIKVMDAHVNSGSVENGGGGGIGTFGADTGNIDDTDDAIVTSLTQVYDDAANTAPVTDYASVPSDAEELLATVELDGLDPADEIILAIDVLLGCGAGEGTGNIQAQVDSATDTTGGGSDAVQVGQQTVPFKHFGIVEPANPAIDIQKTPDLQELVGGGLVEFTITVTNVGDVDLTDTAVTDVEAPDCDADAATVALLTGSDGVVGSVLSPGEWFSYTCLLELADEVVNVAAVSAMWEAQEVTDEDDAVVEVAEIEITKTLLTPTPLVGGGLVEFEIHVENIGHVRLRVTRVLDSKTPECARSASEVRAMPNDQGGTVGIRFTPGESITYTCLAEISQSYTNTATAAARTEVFRWWLYDEDSAVVDVVNPDIEIQKTPDEQETAGGLISFHIVVTNNGDQRLKNVEVSDPNAPDCSRTIEEVKALPNTDGGTVGVKLTPGETFEYDCFAEVAESFTNTATVTGVSEDDLYNVEDSDGAHVTVVS